MEELLKYAVENGILDLAHISQEIEMRKRDKYIAKHPYKIWCGKDGRWRTYLPDKERGRILKCRPSEKEIRNIICEYWKEQEVDPTVRDIYDEWINSKVDLNEITIATKNRYDRQYNQCMTVFGKKKIKSLCEHDIEEFLVSALRSNHMTAKGFSNLKTIVSGIFKRAKKKGLVDYSISEIISDMEISRKSYRKTKKDDDELIFMDEEIKLLIEYFANRTLDAKDLGIILIFYTGMRPGELSALQWSDIDGDMINICRTEIRYEDREGHYIYEVRDFPKTEAGIRSIVIPESAKPILEKIRLLNPGGTYVFENNGTRIKSCCFDKRLRVICKKIGIKEKSLNKIRKTYATLLIDGGADESLIISMMGHTDIQTTKAYYYKNRKNIFQKKEIVDDLFKDMNLVGVLSAG